MGPTPKILNFYFISDFNIFSLDSLWTFSCLFFFQTEKTKSYGFRDKGITKGTNAQNDFFFVLNPICLHVFFIGFLWIKILFGRISRILFCHFLFGFVFALNFLFLFLFGFVFVLNFCFRFLFCLFLFCILHWGRGRRCGDRMVVWIYSRKSKSSLF